MFIYRQGSTVFVYDLDRQNSCMKLTDLRLGDEYNMIAFLDNCVYLANETNIQFFDIPSPDGLDQLFKNGMDATMSFASCTNNSLDVVNYKIKGMMLHFYSFDSTLHYVLFIMETTDN